MNKFLAIALLVVSANAFADDYITVNLASKHIGAKTDFNETNLGLGYAWDTKWKWVGEVQPQVGFYNNSDSDMTAYFSVGKSLVNTRDNVWGAGVMVGAAVGYDHVPVMPMLALVGIYRQKHFHVNVLLSAYTDGEDNGKAKPLIGVQLSFPLGRKQ